MTVRLSVILLLTSFSASGQESTYEQVAWEFYNDKIFKDADIKDKTTFWGPVFSLCLLSYDTVCSNKLGFDITKKERRTDGQTSKFTYTHLDRFKIKDGGRGKRPRVYMTTSFSNQENQQIVTIVEEYKKRAVLYHIEMLDDGKIKNWCTQTLGEGSNPTAGNTMFAQWWRDEQF
jgi:hypothetical protein